MTAGGIELSAAFAEAAPQVTADDQMEFALVITDAVPVAAEVADPTVSVGDGVNLISEAQFGETVYVSLYVKSLDPNYGIQYGYCSLRYDEAGVTSGVYYDGPNFDTATVNDGFDFSSVGCISAFGGEPSNTSAAYGKTGWALVGTMSFSADVVGQYEFTTGVAVNAKGEERESWGFVREDFDDTYEYGTPDVSASLAITGEMPVIEDVSVEGWIGGYDGYAHSITVNDPSAETDKILYSTDGVNYNLTVCPEYAEDGIYTTYVRVSRQGYANWYGSATVEVQHVAPVVTTLEDTVDSGDHEMSLREAIGRALDGDVITFDPSLAGGTITLNGTRLDVSASIVIDASEIGGIAINADGQSRIFFTNGGTEENPIEFIGLTITGGFAKGGGAGIFMNGGALRLTDCTVTGNTASYSNGAGIYNEGGSLTVTGSGISKNYADNGGNGGGIYSNGGSVTVTDSEISENYAYSLNGGGFGGGIYISGSSVTVTGSVISENYTDYLGGGIYGTGGSITVTRSNVLGNSTVDGAGGIGCEHVTLTVTDSNISGNRTGYGDGGGIRVYYGTLTLTNSTVSGNTVGVYYNAYSGGGIYNAYGTLTITGSVISGNSASCGGGLYIYANANANSSGTSTITDSVISENTAIQYGGGIYNFSDGYGTLTITNSLFTDNSANLDGGGIYNCNNRYSTLTITNSTLSRNSARSGGGICCEENSGYSGTNTVVLTNTVVAQNSSDTDWTDVYINSGPLNAYNTLSSFTGWTESENCLVYDPTQPLFEDAENGDYTLAKYSQAVNMGDNSYVETETDLAGNQRIVNGVVDLGAYERQELGASVMLTGTRSYYVSYGANRHRLEWEPVADALSYELAYSTDGLNWTRIKTEETSAIVTGLTYGDVISYRVRALGEGVFIDSDWSEIKSFAVCPMDINNDYAIAGADRRLVSASWLSEEGDDSYRYYADINADGDISNADRAYLTNNWLKDVGEDELNYPKPATADMVFAEFASADFGADLDVF